MRPSIDCRLLPTLLLIATIMTIQTHACPKSCSCKWKYGKEWVECANRNLTNLPKGAREETQVLDLSNNNLDILESKVFQELHLVNLQKLFISKSGLYEISDEAFVGLRGLVELDLNNNKITKVPSVALSSCPDLMKLILNKNGIRIIEKNAFQHLSQLASLELSNCEINNIEKGAFNGLKSLEKLRLNGNKLKFIPELTLPLRTDLRDLALHNNPWHCDCHLRSMQSELKLSNTPATAFQESQPICNTPIKLHDKPIKDIKIDDLACIPEINVDEFLEFDEGDNVTLQCHVYAEPIANVYWQFNGEKCELQNENDSSLVTDSRYTCKQRGQINMTNILYIYGVDKNDEGIFTCIAKNTAGIIEKNLSLKIKLIEKTTIEPLYDNKKNGYITVLIAGSLVGILLVIGLIIGCLIYCTKKIRDRKRNVKTLSSQNKIITPIINNKECETVTGKTPAANLNYDNQQQVMYTERDLSHTSSLEHRNGGAGSGNNDTTDVYRNSVSKYLTEPDLINEVYPSTTNPSDPSDNYALYHQHQQVQQIQQQQIQQQQQQQIQQQQHLQQHSHPHQLQLQLHHQHTHPQHLIQPRHMLDYNPETRYSLQPTTIDPRPSLSHLSYLDQDGYPLNFGLPKISLNSTSCTLPRLRHRMPEGSAAAPTARYAREAEFLSRSSTHDTAPLPHTHTRYTADGYPYPIVYQQITSPVRQQLQIPPYVSVTPEIIVPQQQQQQQVSDVQEVPFIPSPPAAYKGEPTPLSPRSLLSKTAREAAAAVAARADNNNIRPPDHPESPDEGYVGDAMDV